MPLPPTVPSARTSNQDAHSTVQHEQRTPFSDPSQPPNDPFNHSGFNLGHRRERSHLFQYLHCTTEVTVPHARVQERVERHDIRLLILVVAYQLEHQFRSAEIPHAAVPLEHDGVRDLGEEEPQPYEGHDYVNIRRRSKIRPCVYATAGGKSDPPRNH